MKKKVIVNADDLGLTAGCNRGIIEGIRRGVVTSTTVMMNMPYAPEGIKELKAMGFESVGLHLTLTSGQPTLPIKYISSLVDKEYNFHKKKICRISGRMAGLFPKWVGLFSKICLKEVENELRKQIELFIKTGWSPSHLDSHHSVHVYDGIREVVIKLAKEYDLPLRHVNEKSKQYLKAEGILTTDTFSGEFYGDGATLQTFKDSLLNFVGNSIEIMVHPAVVDEELFRLSNYNIERQKELEILTDGNLKDWINNNGFELIGFHEL